jgi:hypothetical protein
MVDRYFERGLAQDLPPMRQHQHTFAALYRPHDYVCGNNGLAAAGRQHIERLGGGFDLIDSSRLIIPEIRHLDLGSRLQGQY